MGTRATTLFSSQKLVQWLSPVNGTMSGAGDALIDLIGDWASEHIEKETRVPFVTRTVTEKYDGSGNEYLRLRRFPVSSVTTLKIKEEQEAAAFTTMNPSGYEVFGTDDPAELKSGVIRLKSTASITTFPSLYQNVEVTYVVGFGAQDSADLPADIYRAGLDLAKFAWLQHTSQGIAATQITIGPGNYVFKAALPFEIQNVLDDWRQPLVA